MKTRFASPSSRSWFAVALLAAMIPSSVLVVRAATITWDGGGVGGTDLNTAANWVGDTLPTTSDEVLFDNSAVGTLPSPLLLNTATVTIGDLIWNSNDSGTFSMNGSSGHQSITVTGGGGSTAAVAAGGAAGDLVVVGSAKTSGTVTIGGTNPSGTSKLYFIPATSGSIDVVSAGATLVINSQFASTAGGNVLSASGSYLKKTGAGALTLANNNNSFTLFSGGTSDKKFILDQGTLNINGSGVIGNTRATFEIHGGTTVDNTAGSAVTMNNYLQNWTGDFTFKGSNALNMGAGAVTLSGSGTARTITVTASTLTVGGVVGGTGYGITKAGAGTLTLAGANTYDGATTVNAGMLSLAAGGSLNTATSLVVNGGATSAAAGTFDLGGQNQTVAQLSGGGGTVTGKVQNNGANSTATLTVTGTSVFDGTLRDGPSSPGTRLLALAKSTGGVLKLTGANTYTGGTTISGGALLANNVSGSATGTGAIIVNGGSFGGTGTASGAITVNAGGAITPGDGGAGTFHGGSSLTWNSDNTIAGMSFDLGANQAASDQLVLTGAFAKGTGSTFVFNFTDAGYMPSFAYTLVTFGSTDFTAGDFSATGVAGTFALVGGTQLQFTAAAIPEPSNFASLAGALSLGGVFAVRRRRA